MTPDLTRGTLLQDLDQLFRDNYQWVYRTERIETETLCGRNLRSSPLRAPSFVPELLDLIGVSGIGLVLSLVLWKVVPIPEITDFVPIVRLVLPVCAGLLLLGIALLGARVYAEFKS